MFGYKATPYSRKSALLGMVCFALWIGPMCQSLLMHSSSEKTQKKDMACGQVRDRASAASCGWHEEGAQPGRRG
jgi:hypothetical protein